MGTPIDHGAWGDEADARFTELAAWRASPEPLAQVCQSSARAGAAMAVARSADAIGNRRQVLFGINPPWPPRINDCRARRQCQHVSAGIVKTGPAAGSRRSAT